MKGWGPKSSVCPSKPRETKLFGRISRDFAGISRGGPKSLRKISLCSIFVLYNNSLLELSPRISEDFWVFS